MSRRSSTGRGRAAGTPVRIADPRHLVADVLRALRRRHPRAGICGGGVGHRWRRSGGVDRVHDERVLRVFVREKLDRRRARREGRAVDWLPRRVPVVLRVFGRDLRFAVPIDVQEPPIAVPTWFAIGVGGGEIQSAAAFATWRRDDGRPGLGVVTAGHGLWEADGAGGHTQLAQATVTMADGALVTGRVRSASLLGSDPVDVGLLEVAATDVAGHGWAPPPAGWPAASVPGQGVYAQLLGGIGDQLEQPAGFRGAAQGSDLCRAVAWLDDVQVAVQGFGTARLRGVVETLAAGPVFVPGTSGAPIGGRGADVVPFGIQSLCLDPGTWSHSLATDFAAAEAWLRADFADSLRLHW